MTRPLKPELFKRQQELQAMLQQVGAELARLRSQIFDDKKQLRRAEEVKISLEAQLQIVLELSQIASQEE
jgi:hypothetical protein